VKADLHLHSEFSWDSKVSISSYIQYAEKREFGALAITDHNDTRSHAILHDLQKTTNVLLIPGQEVSTLDGHLLVYGQVETIPRDLSMRETVITVKTLSMDKPVVCIAAHPFDRLRGGKGRRILNSGIDGIEVLNASTLFQRYNRKAKAFAQGRAYITLANSDSHRVGEFGTAWNELPNFDSVDELLSNLKSSKPEGSIIGVRKKSIRFLRRKLGIMKE
jgi:predicted metal-dependent phosphoesterase TrpH